MLNNTRSPLCVVSARPGLRGVGVAADTLMWHSLCSYRRFDLLRRTEASERSADPRHVAPAEPTPRAQERLVFTQQFLKAKTPTIEGRTPLPGRYNFLVGSDPTQWQTAVSGYAELRYRELWKGIDLKLYGNGQALEQEFIVRPGGDPRRIQVAYRGIEGLAVGRDGSLQIRTAFGTLQESPPRLYQEIGGKRIAVAGRYQLRGTHAYTFEVGPYQPQYALVIDPTLAYSTYLGGSGYEEGTSIVVDAAGNAYVTGRTASTNFPTTTGAFQRAYGGSTDVFVTKLNPTGSALMYSTYLGGSGYEEGGVEQGGVGIAVDAYGSAYVTGLTTSANFPTTVGAFQGTFNGGGADVFVIKLNPTGTALAYSTYLGGSGYEGGVGITVDAAGSAYVTGYTASANFPTTVGAFQGTYGGGPYDAFVAKLNPTGTTLAYSTYLGGSDYEEGLGIAVDANGSAYVTGETRSVNFPTTVGAFQATLSGFADAFVAKLDPTGTTLAYSTYLGGSDYEEGLGIAVDANGSAYVTGETRSVNFPTTVGAFRRTSGGNEDVFVIKLDPTGAALLYSTYVGGSGGEWGNSIAVDAAGNAFVTGETGSSNFPTTSTGYQRKFGGKSDAFVIKLDPTGAALLYSTYVGKSNNEGGACIALDGAGGVYVTGYTYSSNFPTTTGAFQRIFGGTADAFILKFAF